MALESNTRTSAPARPVGIDDRRHLAVRVDRAEFRGVLLALAGIDRHDLIGQAGFLQEQGDLSPGLG